MRKQDVWNESRLYIQSYPQFSSFYHPAKTRCLKAVHSCGLLWGHHGKSGMDRRVTPTVQHNSVTIQDFKLHMKNNEF